MVCSLSDGESRQKGPDHKSADDRQGTHDDGIVKGGRFVLAVRIKTHPVSIVSIWPISKSLGPTP